MERLNRICRFFAGAGLVLLVVGLATIWSVQSTTMSAKAASLSAPKPVDGWYVCRNLGIGAVPGLPDPRQRLKLCHDSGWEVLVYCTQPGLPVPPVGRRCTRIGAQTYRCGASNQRVREYRTIQVPVDTATPTLTPVINTATPTVTLTPPVFIATATHSQRVPTGGEGNAMALQSLLFIEILIILLAAITGGFIVWRVWKRS
jgi:hypothetical protein